MARFNKVTLWVAAIFVGIAILFPNITGVLPADYTPKDTSSVVPIEDTREVTLLISGMT